MRTQFEKDQPHYSAEARKVLWPVIAEMPCMISEMTPVQLHHCHGGSMMEAGIFNSKGLKVSDWLVIPIHARYHVGDFGIDSGDLYWGVVDNWESAFGTQREFIDKLSVILGYNLWEKAGYPHVTYLTRGLV